MRRHYRLHPLYFLIGLIVLFATGCEQADIPTSLDETKSVDPWDEELAKSGADIIPGRFIVSLRDGENPGAVAADHGVEADYVYRHALTGFAGAISEAARQGLLRDARVVLIEPDRIVRTVTTQNNATWGLDRIDQRNLPLSSSFSYTRTGSGVTVYIIDTGIRTSHSDFGSRASVGFDAFSDDQNGQDCNGHGTHVAGTVGGTVYGVAKNARLVAVRVLNCSGSGTISGVIAGVDWVTANNVKPAVANMSLGGGASTALDNAVRRSIAAGISYAIAAGNGNIVGIAQDACKFSPARVAEAMTIGATAANDRKASWSNHGKCLDWFAPGVNITSAWIGGNNATKTISGTSMATPHTAGVAALFLESNSGATPNQVRDALYALTTKGKVSSAKTANNHLLFTSY